MTRKPRLLVTMQLTAASTRIKSRHKQLRELIGVYRNCMSGRRQLEFESTKGEKIKLHGSGMGGVILVQYG